MEKLFESLPTLLIILVVAFVVLIIISSIRRVGRRLRYKLNNLFSLGNLGRMAGINTRDILNAMNEAQSIPEVKSVGGMTPVYLSQIQKDFPNYHNNEIERIVQNALTEYLEIKYGSRSSFTQNVSDRVHVDKVSSKNLSNIKHNAVAIYGYNKASDYATVIYRCSVGYDLDGQRVETRYEINYSYELASDKDENMGLICPVCGGRYESIHDTKCPYCGALVVKDTYLNWFVTSFKEI